MPIATFRAPIAHARRTLRKSTTLVANSGALATATLATGAIGFVYWWLAARMFPPAAVGQASALLSVMGLIGLLGEAGLGTLLIGEIARHRDRAPGLAAAAALVGGALALVLAVAFAIGEAIHVTGANPIGDVKAAVVFVVGCVLTTGGMLASQALVGNLRSTGRMIQQVLFSVIKLGLLGAAAVAGYLSEGTIALTWVAGLLASWVVFDLASRGGARRVFGRPDFALLHQLRRKVADHYALDVTMQAPGVIMPYVVLVLLSPTVNAAFATLWMLVAMASVIPALTATALFPVIRTHPPHARHNIVLSLSASLLFSLVCGVFILLYSQQILALFNPAYPEIAGSSLRFLGFSLVGSAVKSHVCALARLGDWMRRAACWFALGGALEIGMAIAGARLDGLQGLVVGWTLAISLEAAASAFVFGWAVRRAVGRHAAPPGEAVADPAPDRRQPDLVARRADIDGFAPRRNIRDIGGETPRSDAAGSGGLPFDAGRRMGSVYFQSRD